MSNMVTIAAGQGNVTSEATVRLPLTAGSIPEAVDRALTALDRHCKARGLIVAAEYYDIKVDDSGYTVTYSSNPAAL